MRPSSIAVLLLARADEGGAACRWEDNSIGIIAPR